MNPIIKLQVNTLQDIMKSAKELESASLVFNFDNYVIVAFNNELIEYCLYPSLSSSAANMDLSQGILSRILWAVTQFNP